MYSNYLMFSGVLIKNMKKTFKRTYTIKHNYTKVNYNKKIFKRLVHKKV